MSGLPISLVPSPRSPQVERRARWVVVDWLPMETAPGGMQVGGRVRVEALMGGLLNLWAVLSGTKGWWEAGRGHAGADYSSRKGLCFQLGTCLHSAAYWVYTRLLQLYGCRDPASPQPSPHPRMSVPPPPSTTSYTLVSVALPVQVNSLNVPPPPTFKVLYHTSFKEAYIHYRFKGQVGYIRAQRARAGCPAASARDCMKLVYKTLTGLTARLQASSSARQLLLLQYRRRNLLLRRGEGVILGVGLTKIC